MKFCPVESSPSPSTVRRAHLFSAFRVGAFTSCVVFSNNWRWVKQTTGSLVTTNTHTSDNLVAGFFFSRKSIVKKKTGIEESPQKWMNSR